MEGLLVDGPVNRRTSAHWMSWSFQVGDDALNLPGRALDRDAHRVISEGLWGGARLTLGGPVDGCREVVVLKLSRALSWTEGRSACRVLLHHGHDRRPRVPRDATMFRASSDELRPPALRKLSALTGRYRSLIPCPPDGERRMMEAVPIPGMGCNPPG